MPVVKDDRYGQLVGLMLAAPLLPGAEAAVEAAIATLPAGAASPFARLGTVHNARFVLLHDLPRDGQTTLWFSLTCDGTREQMVSGLHRHVAAELDAVFGHTVGFPGAADRRTLGRWVEDHRVPIHYFLAAYPEASLPQIRRALRRRAALSALAVAAQQMDAEELAAAFQAQVAPL